jgi:DNA-directed RNA polymerase specialized sigma24 family protein
VDPESRFRVVFEAGYRPLCRYARHRGLNGPDAEDLVAQVLEIAWRRIGEVPSDEPLPWLYAVAHNLWRNQARKDKRRRDTLARFSASLPAEAVSDPGGLGDPGALRAALASLSDSDAEVLRLVAWDGVTPGELAIVLSCSPVAARTRLYRARARLARKLGIDPDTQRPQQPQSQQRRRSRQKQGDSPDPLEVPR